MFIQLSIPPNIHLAMEDWEQMLKSLLQTNVTNTVHRDVYPAISPTKSELNQAGKAVLITGGGTGVGFAIARSFVQASADTVLIVGRRSGVLATASSELEREAKTAGTNTKIITRTCDVINLSEVEALWKDLSAQGITIDVLVTNAAKFAEPKSILELGADEVWSHFEANAKAPLYFAEKFNTQPGKKPKVSVLSTFIWTSFPFRFWKEWVCLINQSHSSSSTCQPRQCI